MQIISDFHDYYDIGMQNGIDPQLPYRRFRREEPVQFPEDHHRRPFGWQASWLSRYFRCFYFGFAGKIYSCMDIALNEIEPSLCFDSDLIDDSLLFELVKKRHGCWYMSGSGKYQKRTMKRIREDVNKCFEFKNAPELLDLFEKFQTAIFVYKLGSKTIVIDERLNLYHFQKVLPPMEAFQELAMYVGARLTKPVIEEPPISDKIKAEIHGFDKHSFRKAKSKK